MEIDPSTLSRRDAYRTMIACVVPRPIGWISTVDDEGRPNLAPFSYFGAVTSDPMIVTLSVGRRGGQRKDTSMNLLANGEGVIHIPDRPHAEAMVATSADLAPGESEFDAAGLTPLPSRRVRPPRVAEAKIAMEAVLRHHQEVGRTPVDLFLMEILHLHLADDVLVDGLPDPARLRAVGRLGGAGYCDTVAPFEVPRPG